MEYMLMRDGTVKGINQILSYVQVKDALVDDDGVGYYWYTDNYGWRQILTDTNSMTETKVDAEIVPEVVRLAAMLE